MRNPECRSDSSPTSPVTHYSSHVTYLPLVLLFLTILNGCSPSMHTYKRSQLLMGTIVEITVEAGNEEAADKAISAAFKEIRRLEEIMSTYIQVSDISHVNSAAGIEPVRVHRDLIAAVKKAIRFADLSGGAFNIALGPAIDLWKVTESDRIPSNKELDEIRPLIDYKHIIVDETAGTIFLKKKGMRINLGGIGKGIAADYALNILKQHGITSGIIAVAGDLKAFGRKPDGVLWNIGITHPRKKDGFIATVHFSDMSISTSGDYERFFIKNGKRYHHILSPETLQPSVGFQSVSIIAKDSTTTDALSTAIFAMGPEKGFKLLQELPETYWVVVLEDGQIRMSPNLTGNPLVKVELSN